MASIKRNFLYNLFLQVSKVLFPLITAPYVARVLEPNGVGIFNFVNTYSYYFALFAVLGIPTYGIREIAKIRNDLKACETFVSQMVSIECITTLLVSIIYIGAIMVIGQLNENALLFLIAGVTLYICPLKIEWFFSGREEFGFITLRSLVIKTISVIFLFLVVKDKGDLINYVILNTFAIVANEIWNYAKLIKLGIKPRFTLKGTRKHIKPVMILFASSIAISIYIMLDTLMLGFQSTYEEVGYYNSAIHLIKGVLPIATSLATVVLPKVTKYMNDGNIPKINELMTKSLSIVSFMAFPLTTGIILIAPVFVPLFFGQSFTGAIPPMEIGAFLIIATGFNNLEGIQILIALGRDRDFLISVSSGAIVNFFSNMILIPQYGAAGAAFASVIAEVTIVIVMGYYVIKNTPVRIYSFSDVAKSLLGSILFIPIYFICSLYTSEWLFVITMFTFCSVTYLAVQVLLKNSVSYLLYNNIISKFKKS